MPETITQDESLPASYYSMTPWTHSNVLEGQDAEPPEDLIWQRIEAYTAHRYTARTVVWKIEGAGEWVAPLTPVSSISWEVWDGSAWAATTVDAGPYGYCLTTDGPYRATATVGSGTPPEAVQEAWRRLYEYTRGISEQFKGDAAAIKDGDWYEAVRGWTGKALQLSGAADLLRPYRKA